MPSWKSKFGLLVALLLYIGIVLGISAPLILYSGLTPYSYDEMRLLLIIIPIGSLLFVLLLIFYPRITGKLWPT